MTPKFKHPNPENYEFLGHVAGHDLYHFPAPPGHEVLETVIARWGDEPREYTSGLDFAQKVLRGEYPVDVYGRRCEWSAGALALGAALLALRAKNEGRVF